MMLFRSRPGRCTAGDLLACSAIMVSLVLVPLSVRGGLGDVGVGLPDSFGDLACNPAAVGTGGVRYDQGIIHSEVSWRRMAFAGSVFNPAAPGDSSFDVFSGLQLSAVTPQIGAGRIGAGLWQLEQRVLDLHEPLNTALKLDSETSGLVYETYGSGRTQLRQSDETYALGAMWIQEIPGGSMRASLGGAYVTHAFKSSIDVEGLSLITGEDERIFRLTGRRRLNGFAALAGFFYRPAPDYSFGISFMHVAPLTGNVWEQTEGGGLNMDDLERPAQERIGVGASVAMMADLVVSADFHYITGIDMTATLFAGTPAQVSFREKSEAAIDARLGVAYPVRIAGMRIPLRAGFFMQPDSLPAQTDGVAVNAISQFRPVSFVQDLLGWTVGGSWETEDLKVSLSFYWLQISTHVKLQGPSGWVDSADARNSLGASAGVSLFFGGDRGLEAP